MKRYKGHERKQVQKEQVGTEEGDVERKNKLLRKEKGGRSKEEINPSHTSVTYAWCPVSAIKGTQHHE